MEIPLRSPNHLAYSHMVVIIAVHLDVEIERKEGRLTQLYSRAAAGYLQAEKVSIATQRSERHTIHH